MCMMTDSLMLSSFAWNQEGMDEKKIIWLWVKESWSQVQVMILDLLHSALGYQSSSLKEV